MDAESHYLLSVSPPLQKATLQRKMASVSTAPDFLVYDYLQSMDNVFANMLDELEIPEDEMIELLGISLDSS